MENIEIKITAAVENAQAAKSVQELRKSLKELNSLALQTQGVNSKAFDKIASSIGNTQDRMEDLRDEFVAFKGSALEKFNATLQMTKEGFANLDFDKVGTSLKNLGKIIISNPILLLSTVIIAVVQNFDKLVAAGGLLGSSLKFIGDLVNGIIETFKSLSDQMGLTAFAAEESAARQVAALKKVGEEADKQYDHRIALLEAEGKSSLKLQREKELFNRIFAEKQIEFIEKQSGKLEESDIEELRRLTIKRNAYIDSNGVKERLSKEEEKRFQELGLKNAKVDHKLLQSKKENIKELELTIKQSNLNLEILDKKIEKEEIDIDAKRIKRVKHIETEEINSIELVGDRRNKIQKEIQDKLDSDLDNAQVARMKKGLNGLEKEKEENDKFIAKTESERLIKEKEQEQLKAQLATDVINLTSNAFQQELMIAQEKADSETQIEIEKNERIKEIIDDRLQYNIDSIQKDVEAGILSQEGANERAKVLQDQAAKDKLSIDNKTKELQVKAFERAKKYQLAQVAINLASEISAIAVNAAANPTNAVTFGGAGISQAAILSALAITKSALQVRNITSQQAPAFAEGGLVTGAGTGTSDSINARLSNGESVINANSTAQFGNILSMINEAGGGRSFKGVENKNTSGSSSNNSSSAPIRAYVVESEISTSQKKSNRINRLTSY